MRQKAFTLVELIGIMVVLGLIILVGVPALTTSLRKANEEEYERIIRTFNLAAETYVQINKENDGALIGLNTPNTPVYITLNVLKQNGYIKSGIVNPLTDSVFDYNQAVKAFKNSDGVIEYSCCEVPS